VLVVRALQPLIWHKKDKEIYRVVTISFHPGHEHVRYYPDYSADPDDIQEAWFGDVEFMYPTGLKDKHGKEIYEGAIVQYKDYSNGAYLMGKQPMTKDVIKWKAEYCGYKLKGKGYTFKGSDVEVIGNIFENPELLEEAK
jgi:uncharacterized phage protein (TIGR01671 family)